MKGITGTIEVYKLQELTPQVYFVKLAGKVLFYKNHYLNIMEQKDRSSVLLSIFKRKGGEGQFTKVINEFNYDHYASIHAYLSSGEKALIAYYLSEIEWLCFTNRRILVFRNDTLLSILYIEIKEVGLALKEEAESGKKNLSEFSKMKILEKNGVTHILEFEQGESFKGLYQVLHFLV